MRALLAIGLALLLAPAAQAAHWTNPDVQTAIKIADAHWPDSPCQGREQILWLSSDQVAPGLTDDDGYADASTCTASIVWDNVSRDSWPTDDPAHLCAVLEHEFGHLAGFGHSNDISNVMYPLITETPDCIQALPLTTRRCNRYTAQRMIWTTRPALTTRGWERAHAFGDCAPTRLLRFP